MNDKSKAADDVAGVGRVLREQLATATGGLAPDVYVNAWWDWYLNVAQKPGKQAEILQDRSEEHTLNSSHPSISRMPSSA